MSKVVQVDDREIMVYCGGVLTPMVVLGGKLICSRCGKQHPVVT